MSLVVVGCSDDESAEPRPRPVDLTTTSVIDRSGIALEPVGGEPTTTVQTVGSARIVGSVRGPTGPVGGATVRIERLVAGQEVRTDVLSGPDGTFVLDAVPGGRYRVRAFQAPRLAQVEPELRFLADGEEHSFDLAVEEQVGLVVRSSVAPDPARLGRAVNLVAMVAEREVGPDGVLRTRPRAGVEVELDGLGRWILREDDPDVTGPASRRVDGTATTDAAGQVRYELRCVVLGPPGLSLRVPVTVRPPSPVDPAQAPTTDTAVPEPLVRVEAVPLDLAPCVNPEAPATTAPGGDTSSTTDDR